MQANAVTSPYPIIPLVLMGVGRTIRNKGTGLWHDIGRLGLLIAGLAVIYTLYVFVYEPGSVLDWINTLLSTLISVFSALVIGLALFSHQTKETDRKAKAELSRLLRSELNELREMFEGSRTEVPDEALEEGPANYTMRVSLHYAHPLVVEEAARSGLFDERQTTLMLRLARNMRAHQVRVQDATMADFWTQMYKVTNYDSMSFMTHGVMSARYAEAGRSVQRSEERIIGGCEALLDILESESQTAG